MVSRWGREYKDGKFGNVDVERQQFNQLEKPVIRTDNGPQFISQTWIIVM
jgi:hypothetical protein